MKQQHSTMDVETPPVDPPTDAEPTVPAMHGHDPERPDAPPVDPFPRDELAEFDRDDVSAGRHIGKMLAFFFLYTVVVMTIVALWTLAAIE